MRRNERCSPRQDVNVTFSDSAQNYSFTFYIFLSQYLHIRLYATHFTGSRGVWQPIQFLSNWVKEPKLSPQSIFWHKCINLKRDTHKIVRHMMSQHNFNFSQIFQIVTDDFIDDETAFQFPGCEKSCVNIDIVHLLLFVKTGSLSISTLLSRNWWTIFPVFYRNLTISKNLFLRRRAYNEFWTRVRKVLKMRHANVSEIFTIWKQ
jgi:hypothetical protein